MPDSFKLDLPDSTFAIARSVVTEEILEHIEAFRGRGEARSILGSVNEVWLGRPQAIDLLALKTQGVVDEPLFVTNGRKLVLVKFACSFRPAPNCDFTRATVRVITASMIQGDIPVALDVFPREVFLPTTYKRSIKIAPSLKIGVEAVAHVEASLLERTVSTEYVKYDPEITAFGVGNAEFGWDFARTHARPVNGVKILAAIIEKGEGPLLIRFDLKAEIQSRFGPIRLPKFVDSRSGSPIVSEAFQLNTETQV